MQAAAGERGLSASRSRKSCAAHFAASTVKKKKNGAREQQGCQDAHLSRAGACLWGAEVERRSVVAYARAQ